MAGIISVLILIGKNKPNTVLLCIGQLTDLCLINLIAFIVLLCQARLIDLSGVPCNVSK